MIKAYFLPLNWFIGSTPTHISLIRPSNQDQPNKEDRPPAQASYYAIFYYSWLGPSNTRRT